MSDFVVTHGVGEEIARPVLWLYQGSVEHKGTENRFWFEYDERDGETNLEFWSNEPDSDFDFEGFEKFCYGEIEKQMNKENK